MLGTAAVVLAADQITKSLVLRLHPVTGSGLVSVRLVRNTGASGGIAAGYPVLVTLAAVAIVAVATRPRPAMPLVTPFRALGVIQDSITLAL